MIIKDHILINVSTSLASNNSKYASLTIKGLENGEEVKKTVAIWGIPDSFKPELYSLVTLADVTDKDGFLSTKSFNAHFSPLPEGSPLSIFIRKLTPKTNWIKLAKSLLAKTSKDADPLWDKFLKEEYSALYDLYINHAAAKTNHHAYKGGLMDHVYQMLQMLDALSEVLPFAVRIEVCALGILYHDYGKISEYKDGNYTEEFFTMGHIYMGAHVLHSKMTNYGFSYDDTVRTIHCVLAHHGQLEWGSPVKPATGEAFLVHHIDALSGNGIQYDTTDHMQKSFALGTNVIKFKQ